MIDGLPNLTDLPWLNLGGSPTDVQLEGIGVTNLRSLVMAEPIPLRRLVLLVGANGVGKSTFARIFPLLRQSMGTRSRDPILWWDRDGVDFGSFAEAVRKGQEEIRLEFAFRFRDGLQLRTSSALRGDAQTCEVIEWGIGELGAFWRWRRGDEGNVRIVSGGTSFDSHVLRLEASLPLFFPDPSGLFGGTQNELPESWLEIGAALERLFSDNWPTFVEQHREIVGSQSLETVIESQLGIFKRHLRLFRIVEALLTELALDTAYLGPARALPQRLYRSQSLSIETLDSRGDNLPMFLLALTPAETADLNEFLGAHLEFTIRMEPDGSQHSVQLCRRGVWHNLVDVGFGYSQLLPAAVQIWAASRVLTFQRRKSPLKAVVIEQPELHLHPHHQALLGRALCAAGAAPTGPFQIIETHSAALIEEVGLEIARGHIPADQVVVCCFEADEASGATHVRLAEYDAEGVLHGWPAGFLSP